MYYVTCPHCKIRGWMDGKTVVKPINARMQESIVLTNITCARCRKLFIHQQMILRKEESSIENMGKNK